MKKMYTDKKSGKKRCTDRNLENEEKQEHPYETKHIFFLSVFFLYREPYRKTFPFVHVLLLNPHYFALSFRNGFNYPISLALYVFLYIVGRGSKFKKEN